MDEVRNGDELLNRILFSAMKHGVTNIGEFRTAMIVILDDYCISQKSEALTVYTEGKNEMLIKRFLMGKAVAGCSQNTLRFYGKELRGMLEQFDKDADTVSSTDIQIYLAKVMSQSSKVTADNKRRVLSSFYSYMLREELINRNPMSRVDAIKIAKKKKDALSEREVELIRNACRNWRERAIIEMLLSTGCRISELCSIQSAEIQDGKVNILGKGGKYRNVFLNAKAEIAVQNYLAERKDKNPYLLPKCAVLVGMPEADPIRKDRENWYLNPKMVDPYERADKSSVEAIVRNIGARAGVEKVHPHRFRRTCATFALRRGMPIEQVSKMLGHANIATTQIYLDLSEEELEQAHRKYVV